MTTKSVFVIRSSDKERKSRGGFQWPEAGPVEAADWSPKPECGYGLHGLLWGIGNWSLCRCTDPSAVWQVVEVAGDTIVDLEGKVKFPRGVVVYSGSLAGAMSLITAKHFEHLKTAASSGDRSPAASSGYRSPAASSGDRSPAASSGNFSPAASSGYRSPAASSGYSSPAASSGNFSPAASSGDGSPAASSGDGSPAASSGDRSPAASSGDRSPAASSGDRSPAASSGDRSPAASSGYSSPAASSGYRSPAASSGYSSPAASSGNFSPAACLGIGGRAKAGPTGSIIVTYLDAANRPRHAVGYPGENGIEPHVWYEVANGQLVKSANQNDPTT